MSILSASRFATILDEPIALPQTQLMRGSALLIGSYKLLLGQKASLKWLGLSMLSLPDSPVKLTDAFGLLYAGVYAGGFDQVLDISGVPACIVSTNDNEPRYLNPWAQRVFYGPDILEVVISNNMSNVDVNVSAVGCMRLYLQG
jgi:hypothetical protein